jgi:hypothetical protein
MSFASDVFAAFNNSYVDGKKVIPEDQFVIGGGQPQPAQVQDAQPFGFSAGGGYSQPNQPQTAQQQAYTPNPYLAQQADAITQQVTGNLNRSILPQLRGGAQSVGGFGGSRQGVVEANALNDANQGISNALANLYGADYTNAMNRGLQQQSLDNSYNLGLGNLGLNAQNAQNSFYTSQRGQDLQQMGLGSQLAQSANQGYLNQGSGVYDVGSQYQNAPWQTMGNFNSAATPYTGYGATSTTSQGTNPWAQALGGAAMGAQLGRLF